MAREFTVARDNAGTWTMSALTVVSRKGDDAKGKYAVHPTEYRLTVELDGSMMSAVSDVQVAGLRRVFEKCIDQLCIDSSRDLIDTHTSGESIRKTLEADAKVTERNGRTIHLNGKRRVKFSDITAEKTKTQAPPTAEKLAAQAERMTEEEQKALLQKLMAKFAEQQK